MKAIICTNYGNPEVLELKETEIPTISKNEILIQMRAASVTAADTMIRKGQPKFGRLFLGIRKPKNPIPGTGFAGKVVKIGEDVQLFNEGDEVFGETIFGFGTYTEFIKVSDSSLISKLPQGLSYEAAATLCDGPLTSINFLKQLTQIRPDEHILINGASGSLGTAAVQIAKSFGATVTAVCSSKNFELVQALGADYAVDYNTEDFTAKKSSYDIIFDTVGKSSFSKCKQALKKKGNYISPVLSLSLLGSVIWSKLIGTKKAKFSATGMVPKNKLIPLFNEVVEMISNNTLKVVIDKSYPLQAAKEAHKYVDTGRKKGNVVLTMGLKPPM